MDAPAGVFLKRLSQPKTDNRRVLDLLACWRTELADECSVPKMASS